MEKYVECHNCKEKYDCERTYLGVCTDGKAWEQAERKLTDEEIVKDLERYNDEQTIENALDLIHRLQSENAEQKAEIERLIIEKSELSEDAEAFKEQFNQLEPRHMALQKENAELQKQVDELTELCEKTQDEYAKEIADYIKVKIQQAVKDTAEKFAERLKAKQAPLDEYDEISIGSLFKDIDEICKEITEGKV